MEIGSEFILNEDLNCSEEKIMNIINNFPNSVLTSSGRGAISLVLENIKPMNKLVLLPIYICESVISTFEKYNYTVLYYDLNEDFSPQLPMLENIGVFFHMGYFGFATNESIFKEIEIMKQSGVIVIEDITHNLFSCLQEESNSHYYVGSIRKWLGIPSGGFVSGIKELNIKSDVQTNFVNLRIENFKLKKVYLSSKEELLKKVFLKGFSRAEAVLDKDSKPYKIDPKSFEIISNYSVEKLKRIRRQNYSYLLGKIGQCQNVQVVFEDIKKNITPLFFLIDAGKNRDELRAYLAANEIYCPVHWPIAKQVESTIINYKIRDVYSNMISIPCDQRYGIEDMERIVQVISAFGGSKC
ncbi:aspartate aminotransferase family protein [Vagococcus fluvialis]|uniref:hypothetical protein n=1 Tax=Vagococcus fluvialis TaxID=2738 RepID=UPI001D0A6AF9|nr:hypothetical protein [Vagococcus fluvialis]UDM73882.1 hypothetical protein K5K99_13375 [Vagococcus fluvialis]